MFKIDSTTLTEKNTYVIAEGGLNHNGDINIAKKLIDSAKECGANAIKFQTYKTENFVRETNQYFDVFKNAELNFEQFEELKNYSKNIGLTFFSTPFDIESAEFLNQLEIPCFKIASSDLTNLPLITKIAKMQKPMIISSGLSTMNEINDTVNCCLFEGNNQIALLHCVANYPAQPNEVNMNVINTLKKTFGFPIGYSDNGESSLVDIVAVSMGANIIEKHFTLDKKMDGPDHKLSADPKELRELIKKVRTVEKVLGKPRKQFLKSEQKFRIAMRRSIGFNQNLQKDTKITQSMLTYYRPGDGIEPNMIKNVIGRKLKQNVTKGTFVNWNMI